MTEMSLLGAVKRLENMGEILGRDAATVVLDSENDDAWLDS